MSSIFEKTRGRVWMRRVRSNRTLGRARPRLLELLENSLVCTKEENEEKKRTIGLERVDAIVKGIPVAICDENEMEKIIGGKNNTGKFFTVLVSNELTKSIVLEATSTTEGKALRKGLNKLLRRYQEGLSASETSKERILEVWAAFFENCAKIRFDGVRFDSATRLDSTSRVDEEEDAVLTKTLDSHQTSHWEEYVDEDTGFKYYYDSISGETVWKDEEEWEECFDESTGLTYYYNTITKESVWNLNEEEEETTTNTWEECVDEDTGSTYYYNHISGESVWKSEDKEEETSCWEECHDEETGLTYYYNLVSGESVWQIDEGREEEEQQQQEEEQEDNKDEWIGYDGYYAYVVEAQDGDDKFLDLELNDWISVDGYYLQSEIGFGTCDRTGKSGWFPMRIVSFEEV